MVEFNTHAAATVQFNVEKGVRLVADWPFVRADVRTIDWGSYRGAVQVVAGGPPCQPFSVGGRAAGNSDTRDMWPEAIRAVREIQPDIFIFENVRGLLRPAFGEYVQWIRTYLAHPDKLSRDGRPAWPLPRLGGEPLYDVNVFPVNAADFGAPQKRHRVFFVGVRRSMAVALGSLEPTHSQERLVWEKWISGEYWDRHKVARRFRKLESQSEARLVASLRGRMFAPTTSAWVTCRDALIGLGEPTARDDGRNHRFQPGARSYAGHTGSLMDEPAKALKAGVHGVPGGENMLRLDSGKVRYFSVREAARLQGIPDDFEFPGSWTESMRQIGNAVPTMLATQVAAWIFQSVYGRNLQRAA